MSQSGVLDIGLLVFGVVLLWLVCWSRCLFLDCYGLSLESRPRTLLRCFEHVNHQEFRQRLAAPLHELIDGHLGQIPKKSLADSHSVTVR